VDNEYTRSVRREGNIKALKAINQVFKPQNVSWRGFPEIEASGMGIKPEFEKYDARIKFEDYLHDLDRSTLEEPPGCICGDVLRGAAEPMECTLFTTKCTPQIPIGPCMVSVEGTCQIEYRYKRRGRPIQQSG
jgi:hydrogenase expression/formation protein HypD